MFWRKRPITVSASLLLLLVLVMRELNWSEPLVSDLRDKVGVVIIGLETVEDNEVRPQCRLDLLARMYGFEQVIINNVKLGLM